MTALLTPDELSPTQAEMLACGEFHVDGSMRPAGIEAAAALECKGFATSTIGGDSQYTAINYTVTESGKDALIAYVKAQAAKLAKVRESLSAIPGICERLAHVTKGVGEAGCIDIAHEAEASLRALHRDVTAILENQS